MGDYLWGSTWPLKFRTVPKIPPTCLFCPAPEATKSRRETDPLLHVYLTLVPQTEKVQPEVMNSTISIILEDLKPVSRKAECLGQEGYCCFDTLRSGTMEKGRFAGNEERGKAHLPGHFWPQIAAHGLHLSLFCGQHCDEPSGDTEL